MFLADRESKFIKQMSVPKEAEFIQSFFSLPLMFILLNLLKDIRVSLYFTKTVQII
jgi:hypothetical protein